MHNIITMIIIIVNVDPQINELSNNGKNSLENLGFQNSSEYWFSIEGNSRLCNHIT